jgi:hypothetical protein
MRLFLALAALLFVTGCQTGIPADALDLKPDSLERRQLESRRFDGGKEADILAACSGVAQDLGFTIDEAETKLGVMVASKNREASDTGSRVAMALLLGANAANSMDRSQKIRLCIVVKPVETKLGAPTQYVVRATFQRMVWNSYGQLTRLEGLREVELYQQFFEKLSKSVFLEAHKI